MEAHPRNPSQDFQNFPTGQNPDGCLVYTTSYLVRSNHQEPDTDQFEKKTWLYNTVSQSSVPVYITPELETLSI